MSCGEGAAATRGGHAGAFGVLSITYARGTPHLRESACGVGEENIGPDSVAAAEADAEREAAAATLCSQEEPSTQVCPEAA